jgi:hypothetical protein
VALKKSNFSMSLLIEGRTVERFDRDLEGEVLVGVTYKAVQEMLRDAGIVISKKGDIHRINFFGGLEASAYYTKDLQEALEKGLEMGKHRQPQQK